MGVFLLGLFLSFVLPSLIYLLTVTAALAKFLRKRWVLWLTTLFATLIVGITYYMQVKVKQAWQEQCLYRGCSGISDAAPAMFESLFYMSIAALIIGTLIRYAISTYSWPRWTILPGAIAANGFLLLSILKVNLRPIAA